MQRLEDRVTEPRRTDRELLSSFAHQGDEAAFETFLGRHWASAYRQALRCLGEAADAEDAAQDTFLRIARHLQHGRELPKDVRPWLHAVLLNVVRDQLRRSSTRRRHVHAAQRDAEAWSEPHAERRAELTEVRDRLAQLPLDVRYPLVLHYFEGLTHQEVSQVLDCPVGTASSRIRRGLEQLRAALVAVGFALTLTDLEAMLRASPQLPTPPTPCRDWLSPPHQHTSLLPSTLLGVVALALAVAWVATPTEHPALATAPPPPAVASSPPTSQVPPTALIDDGSARAPDVEGAAPDDLAHTVGNADTWSFAQRVLDAETGAPVDGAVVVLVGQTPNGNHYTEARTDAEGRFHLSAPASLGTARLSARRPGYRPWVRAVANPEGVGDIALEPGDSATLRGTVSHGSDPVATRLQVTVGIPPQTQGRWEGEAQAPTETLEWGIVGETTSATDGSFRLEGLPSGARVRVRPVEARWADTYLDVYPEEPGAAWVRLQAAASLEVEVTLDGRRVDEARVRALWPDGFSEANLRFMGSGRHRLHRVVPGRYGLDVRIPGHPARWEGWVTLTGGETSEVQAALETPRLGTLTCVVRDATGAPQAGVRLRLRSGRRLEEASSDAHGRARFDALPEGSYVLVDDVDGAEERPVEVGGDTTLDWETLPRAAFEGRIVDDLGQPLGRWEVHAQASGVSRTWTTDDDGGFRCLGLPCGEVSLVHMDFETMVPSGLTVSHQGQWTEVVFTRPQTLRVEARLATEVPDGLRVTIRSDRHDVGVSVADGAFRAELVRGRSDEAIQLWIQVSGYLPRTFTVPAEQQVLHLDGWALETGVAVRGRVIGRFGTLGSVTAYGADDTYLGDAQLEANGTFEIRGLPQGPARLIVRDLDRRYERTVAVGAEDLDLGDWVTEDR